MALPPLADWADFFIAEVGASAAPLCRSPIWEVSTWVTAGVLLSLVGAC